MKHINLSNPVDTPQSFVLNQKIYNPYTQQMYNNWKSDEYNGISSIITQLLHPLLMHQTTHWEMFLLSSACGFRVEDICHSYNGDKKKLHVMNSA